MDKAANLKENKKATFYIRRQFEMAKRKAQSNAVEKYSKTPHENNHENEFSVEFSDGEQAIKGANRNSKLGKKGRM